MQNYTKQAKIAEREVGILQAALEQAVVIKNDNDLKMSTEFLIKVKSVSKVIFEQKNPIVKSLNEALREVRELFKPGEEAQRIEKKVDEGKMKLSTGMGKISKIPQGSQPIQTKSGSAQFRTIKRIRITDISKLTSYLIRDRVQEAVRIEVAEDVRRGQPVPDGAELHEEKVVAGVGG